MNSGELQGLSMKNFVPQGSKSQMTKVMTLDVCESAEESSTISCPQISVKRDRKLEDKRSDRLATSRTDENVKKNSVRLFT